MRFNLASMTAKRRSVTLPLILSTKAQADALSIIAQRALAPLDLVPATIVPIYERELARAMTTDSADDLANAIDGIGDVIRRLVLELTPAMRDWAFRVENWQRGKWQRAVLSGLGLDISALIGPQDATETVGTFLGRMTALVRDVGDEARGRISDAVFRGLQERQTPADVTKAIAEATGMARARARRVSGDQTVKLATALNRERQRQAGIDLFRYRHGGKAHPRSWHKARDGKLYEIDSGREVIVEDGERRFGPDTIAKDDRPGAPPFCSCAEQAVVVIGGEVLG